ncbi:uncharacterized protein LOC143470008 isoform X2 [Clavelina lepadiformis]|uniref:uncharacterized protein LOC143470008 isoform X2 n=1 Tax=Clavelina lepadiformis TaxID=159417 RepID=UPI004042A979
MSVLPETIVAKETMQLQNSRISEKSFFPDTLDLDSNYSITNMDSLEQSPLSTKQSSSVTLPEISEFLREETLQGFQYSWQRSENESEQDAKIAPWKGKESQGFQTYFTESATNVPVHLKIIKLETLHDKSTQSHSDGNAWKVKPENTSSDMTWTMTSPTQHYSFNMTQSITSPNSIANNLNETNTCDVTNRPENIFLNSQHFYPPYQLSHVKQETMNNHFFPQPTRQTQTFSFGNSPVEGNFPQTETFEEKNDLDKIDDVIDNPVPLLRPGFDFEAVTWTRPEATEVSLSNDLLEDGDLRAVDSTCMEKIEQEYHREALKDITLACSSKNLNPDPHLWSADDVKKWILWTINQCRLPAFEFSKLLVPGVELCHMTEEDMLSMAPPCGDILHSRLHVWMSAWRATSYQSNHQVFSQLSSDVSGERGNLHALGENGGNVSAVLSQRERAGKDTRANANNSENETMATITPNHTSSIHLWEFLKELLLQPQAYGRFIRWINKDRGVFKIEDSSEVARLWGVRKNRPAMNYDKLSRSIRQYYKKGIIKKTTISQRLVYQFVKPITAANRLHVA